MKQYGMNKATEFTSKQISVIYGMAKRQELKVEKFAIKEMYNLADYYGHDYDGQVARNESSVLRILENVFANNLEETQRLIDLFTESTFNSYTPKYQAKLDRSLI